jgi:D-3-phosphoglycerate dehydrogenase / 2-oxoglutarate reductase
VPGKVLVTDHVFADLEPARAALSPLGYELVLAPATDAATLAPLAQDADAILVTYAQIRDEVLDAAVRGGVKIVARCGIGVDNIDVAGASARGILVTNVPDYCIEEVADHTLTLLLAASRQLVATVDAVRAGEWRIGDAEVHRLRGRRLAVIGLGAIGRAVAARAAPFGYELVGYDPFAPDVPGIERAASVEAAVAEADAITLHLPLTDETRHLIGEASIAAMRRAPIVVNTARGPLVDADAAAAALVDGRIGALALDVTEPEPLPAEHPLRSHPRALITPHVAFYSREAGVELQQRAVDEVVRALSGREPRRPVNGAELAAA